MNPGESIAGGEGRIAITFPAESVITGDPAATAAAA